MSVTERWRHHINHADSAPIDHPFYSDVRKYGRDAFMVETIRSGLGFTEARKAERALIAVTPEHLRYNLSPGGAEDAKFGGIVFWERLNADPEARQIFLQKLSEVKKARDWSDYESMSEAAESWRKEHPKEAYRLAYRAIRLARKARPQPVRKEDTRPLKERLMWKHKRSEMTRKHALAQWARRTEAERVAIGAKISKKLKKRMMDKAILPDFKQEEWPFAKATVLRKMRQGMSREEIIADAIKVVRQRGSHWRDVQAKLQAMRKEGHL